MKAPTNDACTYNDTYAQFACRNPQSIHTTLVVKSIFTGMANAWKMTVVDSFASTSQSPLTFENIALCDFFVFNDITASSLVTAKSHHT